MAQAHICENGMIQINTMLKVIAKWLQLSTEENSAKPKLISAKLITKLSYENTYSITFEMICFCL